MPEHMYVTDSADFKYLCELGFTEDEATMLIIIKERLEAQRHQQELEEQHRLDFIRWLVEHKRLSDQKP